MKLLIAITLAVSVVDTFSASVYNFTADNAQLNSVPFPHAIFQTPCSVTDNPNVAGWLYTNVTTTILGIGNNDVYTVPSGKKLVLNEMLIRSTNANKIYLTVKTNNTYYPISSASSVTAGSAGSISAAAFVYEATETVSVNCTNTADSVTAYCLLIPDTFPVTSIRTTSISSGDNLLFTVPPSKMYSPWASDSTRNLSRQITCSYFNYSGSGRNYKAYQLPNGYTTSTMGPGAVGTLADKSSINVIAGMFLYTGDSMVVNLDANTSTQFFYTTVMVIDNP